MYQQPYQSQPQQYAPPQQSFVVVYPQGIAWRSAPNYNARVTQIQGPVANTQLTGPVVQGQDGLQYLQVGSQFLPITCKPCFSFADFFAAPQGQPLLQPCQNQMQQAMNQDIHRVQQSYQQPVVYQQQPVMMHGGHHNKKMYKKQKHKKSKGYKINLF